MFVVLKWSLFCASSHKVSSYTASHVFCSCNKKLYRSLRKAERHAFAARGSRPDPTVGSLPLAINVEHSSSYKTSELQLEVAASRSGGRMAVSSELTHAAAPCGAYVLCARLQWPCGSELTVYIYTAEPFLHASHSCTLQIPRFRV